MTPEQNKEEFLKALSKLTVKHKLVISGCGCCGSPYLVELDKNTNYYSGDLSFNSQTKRYSA